ncbi:MAG: aquaporin [Lachnospiraceae bacterium]|nr:aquaporin [Lachnospiraceae bacterium]
MNALKKYIAEFIGTFILVFMGCGTAMTVGCDSKNGSGYILTAFAFGLAIVAMAYGVGNVSGGHVNPAVSLSMLISGRMGITDFLAYIVAQCFGAIAGSAVLSLVWDMASLEDKTGSLGSNGLGGVKDNQLAGFIIEAVLTCIFVMTILGVTSAKQKHGSFAGVVIGLTLVGIHIIGIGLTGTSVNPARSLGPALVTAITGDTDNLKDLWVFLVAPLVGAAVGAFVYKFVEKLKPEVIDPEE